ncbi:MAG: hypothetical protein CMP11_07210 [Zetaproteobacteria bacterium]|nr:hypothetical protein [Pseudobdellovibrionaceae bacterium]
MDDQISPSFWMKEKILTAKKKSIEDNNILIIGSGISGVSCAFSLLNKNSQMGISIVDYEVEKSASFRNCGHVLLGSAESPKALLSLHGKEVTKTIWQFSHDACVKLKETIKQHNISCDFKNNGYLVMAIDESESCEIKSSLEILSEIGFPGEFYDHDQVAKLGFKKILAARYDPYSCQVHPVKLRNGLLNFILENENITYSSGVKVLDLEASVDGVKVITDQGTRFFDAVIVACNAYTPFISRSLEAKELVVPFKGQIMTSQPLKHPFQVTYPHSFDHGYMYALVTGDNRLMIGGWRNHIEGGELGQYGLAPNPILESGLDAFVQSHYELQNEKLIWPYSWSGLMASSSSGFPFVGPIEDRVYLCLGYTGYGLAWAHSCGELLANIIFGHSYDSNVAKYLNPRRFYKA